MTDDTVNSSITDSSFIANDITVQDLVEGGRVEDENLLSEVPPEVPPLNFSPRRATVLQSVQSPIVPLTQEFDDVNGYDSNEGPFDDAAKEDGPLVEEEALTGFGDLANGDGDFYKGGLKNDQKHGQGIMQFSDGRTFEGRYFHGQMVQGKMTYQDGSTYDGTWVEGMRHGFGRRVFADESMYEGEFKEGEFCGRGKMTWNDGGWYEGQWLNGAMHGRGREILPDGTLRHDGEWVRGQPTLPE